MTMDLEVKVSEEQFLNLYRKLSMIRQFEEKVDELFRQGRVKGAIHVSVGEEAVAVGVAEALKEKDLVMATHRGHGHCIAKGGDISRMMAELFGRSTGYCRGKGGSMHIIDVKKGMLGAVGIVGAGLPIATGVGVAIKMQKTGQVCACLFGDGASNGGMFHEALNVAALWKLPIVFVCENNLYGLSVSMKKSSAVKDIAVRAKAYDIPGAVVDGMDVLAVWKATEKAVKRARDGMGPSLLECKTYRFLGHSRGDPPYGPYRTQEELETWKKRDPLSLLIKQGGLTSNEVERIDNEVSEVVEEAVRFAAESPEPDVDVALEDIYA